MYGDEEAGIPAEELYSVLDARRAVEDAEKVLRLVDRFSILSLKLFKNSNRNYD